MQRPTPVLLPPLGLGTGLVAQVSAAESAATIQRALQLGVNLIDTAPYYGNGIAEQRVGAALRGVPRAAYVLATKIGIVGALDNGDPDYDWSPAGLQRCLERSLQRLGTDYVDVLHLHEPEGFADVVIADVLPMLERWRESGLVKAISAGVNQWQMVEPFQERLDCVLLAGRYTLLEQVGQPFIEAQAAAGRTVLLGGVFNSGILASGPTPPATYNYRVAPVQIKERVAQLHAACARHGVSLRSAALQFARAHPAVSTLVIGALRPQEISQAVADLSATLPAALWQDLRASGLVSPQSPVPDSAVE